MRFTVIGGNGFVGSAVVSELRESGADVFVPERGEARLSSMALGHVIYAAGITADFRSRPFETLDAHVGHLAFLLKKADFESLLYLSSTRLYRHADGTRENDAIHVQSEELEDFYDLTKLTGESLCHASGRDHVRVARLSNVIGHDFRSANFVFDLIRSAVNGRILLRTALSSTKDYILIEDVARMLPKIALQGGERCYNLASGQNISHADMATAIGNASNALVDVLPDAPCISSPAIDIGRIQQEFAYVPSPVLPRIPFIVNEYRNYQHVQN